MADGDSYELVARYQDGESAAAGEIFDRYVERLIALARSRLGAKLRRRVDAEDVVQSAFRSFFLQARDDQYVLRQSGDLWRLLVAITLRKLYGQAERHQAQRRSISREAVGTLSEAISPEPTPAEVVALVEQLRLTLARLTEDQRLVLTERMQGNEVDEIAHTLQRSPRTVRRLLAEARRSFERELLDGEAKIRSDQKSTCATRIDQRVTLSANDYVLERLLGAGGMGKVYRARERQSGRVVAVKSLRKLHQGDRCAIELFVQEAENLGKLRHPNIVGVHGLGRFPGGGLFIVLEYIDGMSLQERLQDGPLDAYQALTITRSIAIAVAHAHQSKVVHGDLKPANVLLDETGRPVVTDFGFARIVAAHASTQRARIGGTLGYMAPEVFRLGQSPTVAADIFGLGAVLWTLVTGNPPHADTPIRDLNLEPIESICRMCLEEEPRSRYRDVAELLVAIDDALFSN